MHGSTGIYPNIFFKDVPSGVSQANKINSKKLAFAKMRLIF